MDVNILETYKRLVGREVVYVKNGLRKTGKLKSIESDPAYEYDRFVATIEKKQDAISKALSFLVLFSKMEKVPLEQVRIPSDMNVSERSRKPHVPPSANRDQFEDKYFHYDQVTYEKCKLHCLNVGQEVVWLLPESYQTLLPEGVPLIGKVKCVGRHEKGLRNFVYAAVVEFDDITEDFPKFISKEAGRFRNLINVEELLSLSDWLASSDLETDRQPPDSHSSSGAASSSSVSRLDNLLIQSQVQQIQSSAPNHAKNKGGDQISLSQLPSTSRAATPIKVTPPDYDKSEGIAKLNASNSKFVWNKRGEYPSGDYREQIQIKEGATGYSYDSIFSNFLDDSVHRVEIEDPYIRSLHQCDNFLRFIGVCLKHCPNLEMIVLTTKADKNRLDQISKLVKIQSSVESLPGRYVQVCIDYSDALHDREIRFDNGWVIKIGRGLDYFKPAHRLSVEWIDDHFRPCKATTVDVFHNKNVRRLH